MSSVNMVRRDPSAAVGPILVSTVRLPIGIRLAFQRSDTTTTCGAVKEAVKGLEHDFGFVVAGGKGATARRTPVEITAPCERLAYSPDSLISTSRLVAKIDSAAVQDGYQLYHLCFSLP